MKKPKVSVVMPVFNGEKYLKPAIESILNQKFKDFEFIIVNDASNDRSVKIINSFKDKRIKLFHNKVNQGVTKSLNLGLKKSSGKYIARMDADDISVTDRLKKQTTFLDTHPDYFLVGSNCEWLNANSKKIQGFKVATDDPQIRKRMFIRNQFHHASTMFRQAGLKKVGVYKVEFNGAEDYELWFRLLRIGKGYNFSEELIKRRILSTAVSTKHHIKIEILAIFVRLINIWSIRL